MILPPLSNIIGGKGCPGKRGGREGWGSSPGGGTHFKRPEIASSALSRTELAQWFPKITRDRGSFRISI